VSAVGPPTQWARAARSGGPAAAHAAAAARAALGAAAGKRARGGQGPLDRGPAAVVSVRDRESRRGRNGSGGVATGELWA